MRFLLYQAISVSTLPIIVTAIGLSGLYTQGAVIQVSIPPAVLIAVVFASGPVWGYWIPRKRGYAIARWTWIMPVVLLLASFLWDCASIGFHNALKEFIDVGAENGEAGWVFWLFVLPVISAVLYSMGAAVGYFAMKHEGLSQGVDA